MRSAKGSRVCVHKFALERFLGSERDGVQKQIESIGLPAYFLENLVIFLVTANVAGEERHVFAEFADQLLNVFL